MGTPKSQNQKSIVSCSKALDTNLWITYQMFPFAIAQYCPQNPPQPRNITLDNCGSNWPEQHNVDDVSGLAPCLEEKDKDKNFPCTTTKNINWFLNTMNDCFSQSNVIFNQDNFIGVLGNSQYYKGLNIIICLCNIDGVKMF